jgi:two-component SAPR family response regulator
MLKYIGIDDDSFQLLILKVQCRSISSLEHIGSFTNPFKAFPLIKSGQLDLIFLDYELGTITAPDVLKHVPERTQVIIVSGNSSSALASLKMNVTAILSKPFTNYQLKKAIALVKSKISK